MNDTNCKGCEALTTQRDALKTSLEELLAWVEPMRPGGTQPSWSPEAAAALALCDAPSAESAVPP